jgi:hypothetical protein
MEKQKVMTEASAAQKKLLEEKAAAIKAAKGETPAAAVAAGAEGQEEEEEPKVELDEEAQKQLAEQFKEKIQAINPKALGIAINPNCFLDYEFDVDAAVVKKDEDTARELATFLWEVMLPAVTKQVREGDISVKDNAALVKVLHSSGVNMRYLGALADLAKAEEDDDRALLGKGQQRVRSMPLFWREMLTVEMLARACKYVLNSYYKSSPAVYAAPAQTIASLLNHLVGALVPTEEELAAAAAALAAATAAAAGEASTGGAVAAGTTSGASAASTASAQDGKKKKKKGGKSDVAAPASAAAAAVSAKKSGAAAAADKAEKLSIFSSPDATESKEACLKLLSSNLSQRFLANLYLSPEQEQEGVTEEQKAAAEAARKEITSFLKTRVHPITLVRRVCQVCGIQIATKRYNFDSETPFSASDIITLVPIIKTCEPDVLLPEFHALMETASEFMHEGNYPYAYESVQQAINTITQVTGPYHANTAVAIDNLANVLIGAGDLRAGRTFSHKSLAIVVQLYGFDSQESLVHHIRLAVLEAELGNTALSAQHWLTAKYLIKLMGGNMHTELSTIYSRLAALYESVGDFHSSIVAYSAAKNYSHDVMTTCNHNVNLASVFSKAGAKLEALETHRSAFAVMKELVRDEESEEMQAMKAALEQYLNDVNVEKATQLSMMNDRVAELSAQMDAAKLKKAIAGAGGAAVPSIVQNNQAAGGAAGGAAGAAAAPTAKQIQLSDDELIKEFARMDRDAEKARKKLLAQQHAAKKAGKK